MDVTEKSTVDVTSKIDFPSDWKQTRLGKEGEFLKGKGIAKKDVHGEGIPCVLYGEIYTKHHNVIRVIHSFIPEEMAMNSKLLEKGDIVFACSGETREDIGKSAAFIDEFEAYASGDTIILRGHNCHPEFLGYFLNSYYIRRQLYKAGQGVSVVHVYSRDLEKIEVYLPPLPEQRKIAEILSTWDEAIELTQKLIEQLKLRKKGLMQQLLTGKKRLPGFEGEWEYKRLEEILSYEQPTKYRVSSTDYSDDNPIPVLTAGKTFVLGYTAESEGVYTSVLPVIIFDDFTTAKKFVDFPFKVKSSAMKILKAKNSSVNMKVVYEIMKRIKFSPTDHKRYWISEFSQIEIALPTFDEQNALTEFIEAIDTEVNLQENYLEQLILQKKGLMQQLLTGKTRVPLND